MSPARPRKSRASGARRATRSAAADDPSTRDRMLDAALAAFAELGFDGASTRAIAARAGVNQGLIPYYFGTKEALWKTAVDRAFAELREALEPVGSETDPAAAREGMIRRFVRFAARRPDFSRLMTDEGKRDGPRLDWIVDNHVRPIAHAMRGALAGGAPAGVDPLQLHYVVIGAATHLFHQGPEFERVSGRRASDEDVVAAQEELLVALLAGLGEAAPGS